jgi:hypothetical protein
MSESHIVGVAARGGRDVNWEATFLAHHFAYVPVGYDDPDSFVTTGDNPFRGIVLGPANENWAGK